MTEQRQSDKAGSVPPELLEQTSNLMLAEWILKNLHQYEGDINGGNRDFLAAILQEHWRQAQRGIVRPECGTLSGATPRTDALYERMPRTFNNSADAFWCREMGDHARQLERELAEHRDNGRRLMEAADGWKAEAERLRGVERALERANEEIASRSAIGNTSK